MLIDRGAGGSLTTRNIVGYETPTRSDPRLANGSDDTGTSYVTPMKSDPRRYNESNVTGKKLVTPRRLTHLTRVTHVTPMLTHKNAMQKQKQK
jgi:hypothetical protein